MEHLILCKDCQGKGERVYHYYDKKRKIQIEEVKTCKTCNGKGKVVRRRVYYEYKLLKLIRLTDYYWKILNHKIKIPIKYWYDCAKTCHACRGNGFIKIKIESEDSKKTIIQQTECEKCKGNGIAYTKTVKDMYNEIFNSYIDCKTQKQKIKEILKNKEWEKDEYKEYKEYFPSKQEQVCVRCINYLDGTDGMGGMDTCCGCVNESELNDNGYSYFQPVNEKAKKWYNNGGYKYNLCYDKKHNYIVK